MTSKKNGNGNGHNGYEHAINSIFSNGNPLHIPLKKKINIEAKTENQKEVIKSIKSNIVTIIQGYCGSGKTRLAVVEGLRMLAEGKVDKLIFTRPCIEANGENLGFLPGDLHEKISPYMIPIFDFLGEFLEQKSIELLIAEQKIITLPLAFMRGTNFVKAYVILDECQNANIAQVRMFLTRIGEDCKIVITGDIYQSDISGENGLKDACKRLCGIPSLKIVEMDKSDIIRPIIVEQIENKYREDALLSEIT